ncbi:MAG: hypothetical protein AAFP22_18380, partial [Planctomycetota bacterium]
MQAVKRASLTFVRWFDSWAGTENDDILDALKNSSATRVTEGATKVKEGAAALKESAAAAKTS